MAKAGLEVPLIVHVTVETTGTMLLGSEIGAALTSLEALGIDLIGLNCATGPAEMSEHLRVLSQQATIGISCMPNAGLPVLTNEGAHYPLSPAELADAHEVFVRDYGLSLVGGCCGTTPEHLRQVAERVRGLPIAPGLRCRNLGSHRSTSRCRSNRTAPSSPSASGPMPTDRRPSVRRCWSSAGTTACRRRDQQRDGAHVLDLCVDYVGRDGVADMVTLAGLLATSTTLPIMLDSTEPEVLRAGLEKLGGRSIVNSVNYEDGDGPDPGSRGSCRWSGGTALPWSR